LDNNQQAFPPKEGKNGIKEQQSFDLDEVRDIGTSPIEDESFFINDLT
jgi:hypothetical protein